MRRFRFSVPLHKSVFRTPDTVWDMGFLAVVLVKRPAEPTAWPDKINSEEQDFYGDSRTPDPRRFRGPP